MLRTVTGAAVRAQSQTPVLSSVLCCLGKGQQSQAREGGRAMPISRCPQAQEPNSVSEAPRRIGQS